MWPTLFTLAVLGIGAVHLAWRRRFHQVARRLRLVESELQAMDGRLVRESAQHQTILDSIHQGVMLLDAEGRVLITNRAFGVLFEQRDATKGKSVIEVVRNHEIQALADQLRAGGPPVLREIDTPGPPARRFEVSGGPVHDREGNRIGGVLAIHDITRLKRLEDTRREFVANVSHELRTPLSIVKGYVETLLDGTMEDPVLRPKFLHVIQRHADRLAFLIEDLLTLSRLDAGSLVLNVREVGLHEAAASALDDLSGRAAERDVTLQNEVPTDVIVRADGDRLGQVFFNLIDNAIKYGRPSGTVVIRALPPIEGWLEVQVKDDGPGIPADAVGRVFERFYRVDRARAREDGGTGLGLAIVKHLILAHGGKVWVTSEPGQGATFHFTLPLPQMPVA